LIWRENLPTNLELGDNQPVLSFAPLEFASDSDAVFSRGTAHLAKCKIVDEPEAFRAYEFDKSSIISIFCPAGAIDGVEYLPVSPSPKGRVAFSVDFYRGWTTSRIGELRSAIIRDPTAEFADAHACFPNPLGRFRQRPFIQTDNVAALIKEYSMSSRSIT
jgi:hypothetical protein